MFYENLPLIQRTLLSDIIFDALSHTYAECVRSNRSKYSTNKALLCEATFVEEAKGILTPKQVVLDFFERL